MAFCQTLQSFEGDVDLVFEMCCNDDTEPPPTSSPFSAVSTLACPSIKIDNSDRGNMVSSFKQESAIVCESQVQMQNNEPFNPFFSLLKKNQLDQSDKARLCEVIRRFRNPTPQDGILLSTQIQFADPASTKTPVIISHYSSNSNIGFGSEDEKNKLSCATTLGERKNALKQTLRAQLYNDLCEQDYIDRNSQFCQGNGFEHSIAQILSESKADLQKVNNRLLDNCSGISNEGLKDVMRTMINLATSPDRTLNQAAANVCGAVPFMFWRKFNNNKNNIPNQLFTITTCTEPKGGNWELRLPESRSVVNPFIQIYKAQEQWQGATMVDRRCINRNVDQYLNSLKAVVETQFFRSLTPDLLNTPFVNMCRNLRMTAANVNRSNGRIKTGVFGSEFRDLVDGRLNLDSNEISGFGFIEESQGSQMALKDNFMKQSEFIQEKWIDRMYIAHIEDPELYCEQERSLLPAFSNNPFLVQFVVRKRLGGENVRPPSDDDYPLGTFESLEDCVKWGEFE